MASAMPVVGKGIKVGGQAAIKHSGIREGILARNMNKSVLGTVKSPQIPSKVIQYKPPYAKTSSTHTNFYKTKNRINSENR